jgi:phosphoserine/homoserine phosphotransferase
MRLVCLDLEGVLVPEIWIAFSEATGIEELRRTTRDEPDYDKLMRRRLELLKIHGLKLPDIQKVIGEMSPLPGALEFTRSLREKTQLVILSDTFEEFARPLMEKLLWPTLFCNSLVSDAEGTVIDYRLRQKNGKMEAVKAFKSLNIAVFAAGDSFNDLAMIGEADSGCLFRAPRKIREDHLHIPCVETYEELLAEIGVFLKSPDARLKCS